MILLLDLIKKNISYVENKNDSLVFMSGSDSLINFFSNHFEVYTLINKINLIVLFKEKYFHYFLSLISFSNSNEVYNKDNLNPNNFLISEQLNLLKSVYGDKLKLVYLPMDIIIENNNLNFKNVEELEFKKIIFNESKKLNIEIIDMTYDFKNIYLEKNEFGYGFSNTIPGIGHMNELGHKILADKLTEVLKE